MSALLVPTRRPWHVTKHYSSPDKSLWDGHPSSMLRQTGTVNVFREVYVVRVSCVRCSMMVHLFSFTCLSGSGHRPGHISGNPECRAGLMATSTPRYFSASPSDTTSRWTLCPSKLSLRPGRHYPALRCVSASGSQRDSNPLGQCAARRTLWAGPTPGVSSAQLTVYRLAFTHPQTQGNTPGLPGFPYYPSDTLPRSHTSPGSHNLAQ